MNTNIITILYCVDYHGWQYFGCGLHHYTILSRKGES